MAISPRRDGATAQTADTSQNHGRAERDLRQGRAGLDLRRVSAGIASRWHIEEELGHITALDIELARLVVFP